ncbi:hypothetical protein ABEU79_04970 [Geobacillus thermodenitrificans]|uniref:hypothetical protein n=1 Tax=Geobacillus TaxID=129337 RepID=UPI001EF12B35|nr:hypothetical protein [Geobacillus sp. PA-3]
MTRLTKAEKRRRRLQATQIYDRHCRQCPKVNSSLSVCRECPYQQRMQELTRPLWEGNDFDPYFLSHRVGQWSRDEDLYILNHYGVLPLETISARTGRSVRAILKRIEELQKA